MTDGAVLWERIFNATDTGLVLLDRNARVASWNAWMTKHTGIAAHAATGKSLAEVFEESISPRLEMSIEAAIDKSLAGVLSPRLQYEPLPLFRTPSDREYGNRLYQYISVVPLLDHHGERSCLLSISDVTTSMRRELALRERTAQLKELTDELAKTEKKARHMAFHDPLTGLANRALFNDRMKMAISSAARRESLMALILIDIDKFKEINDTHGHDVGDKLIVLIAERVETSIRSTDTAARIGGDEFAIVQTDISAPEGAAILAKKLLEVISEPVEINDVPIVPSASIGVSIHPNDASTAQEIFINADAALYEVKRHGRNNWQCFTKELRASMQDREHFHEKVDAAIRNSEFFVNYQPQIDVTDGTVVALEALIRWRNAHNEVREPEEFIPVAEELGLIDAITREVVREISSASSAWPGSMNVRTIAMNLSAEQLHKSEIVEQLIALQSALAANALQLEVEIAERVFLANPEGAVAVLERLGEHSVRVAIDNFGTGYSSLELLKRVPLDKIKIDRSFTAEIDKDPAAAAMMKSLIDLGHSLGLEVAAEGVETENQATILRRSGCDLLQGFYFSAAVRAEQVAQACTQIEPVQSFKRANIEYA